MKIKIVSELPSEMKQSEYYYHKIWEGTSGTATQCNEKGVQQR